MDGCLGRERSLDIDVNWRVCSIALEISLRPNRSLGDVRYALCVHHMASAAQASRRFQQADGDIFKASNFRDRRRFLIADACHTFAAHPKLQRSSTLSAPMPELPLVDRGDREEAFLERQRVMRRILRREAARLEGIALDLMGLRLALEATKDGMDAALVRASTLGEEEGLLAQAANLRLEADRLCFDHVQKLGIREIDVTRLEKMGIESVAQLRGLGMSGIAKLRRLPGRTRACLWQAVLRFDGSSLPSESLNSGNGG